MENNKLNIDIEFTTVNTNIGKGIAVILLLVHHLFYLKPEVGPIFSGFSPVYFFALISKVCVSIFVLLSGYGLSLSFKNENIYFFWIKRLIKFYFNYWLIWLIFVPAGVFIFGRTFSDVYGNNQLTNVSLNILGLQTFFGELGYNATWWFSSLILSLYALFPLLKALIDRYGILALFLTLPFLFIEIKTGNKPSFDFVYVWLLPFAIGIYAANKNIFVIATHIYSESKIQRKIKAFLIITILILLIIQRQFGYFATGIQVDGPIAAVLIAASFLYLRSSSIYGRSLSILGEHSFNIFLFHTFFYYYFFPDFFYITKFSILSIVPLLIVCLITSFTLEKIKKMAKFYTFEKFIICFFENRITPKKTGIIVY